MKKSKLVTSALALALTVGPLSSSVVAQTTSDLHQELHKSHVHGGAPFDVAIANDERLIKMLKEEGKIANDASPSEAEKVLNQFLENKSEAAKNKKEEKLPGSLGTPLKEQKASSNSLTNGKGNKLGQAKKNKVDSVEEEAYNGEVRSDKVLVLAIDFPDYPTSSITPAETDMYYDEYPNKHFEDMLFGEEGWTGPEGENYVSMKQYYEKQSGGSYTVDGEVAGWYTASQPAAYYGGNDPAPDGNDARPRSLVYEALVAAGADPNVDLSEYDVWDRYDYDGDGVYAEPDGIIDHLMVIHAGVGEEAGGGTLGKDAIWSHRWNFGESIVAVPGGTSNSDRFGGVLGAYDYTIEPEDGAVGVFIHEFGHDLGLPDEYDTQYTGKGEPVSYWSIMSSGSWAGKLPGTMPTGFSPYMKEMLQANHGGNWLSGTTLDAEDVTSEGTAVLLDEGVTKGTNNDAVRVDLPDKVNVVNTPTSGEYEYFSGSGNGLDNSMTQTVDLTGATNAELTFKAWYDIEQDWDYASVKVNGEAVEGNITTSEDPWGYGQNPGHGITGSSDGWVNAEFDLSAYAGQEVVLELNYWTDGYVANPGFYADDITLTVDGEEKISDDAEGDSSFELNGFTKDNGTFLSEHYYLLEWRSHNDVDKGLANIRRGASLMSFDSGLVVWYVDKAYDNNWTGVHPGDGFVGVVDADQKTLYWSDDTVASTRYQVHDAAFSLEKTEKMFLDYTELYGITVKDNHTKRTPLFDDSADYSNKGLIDAGRNVPEYGLKFRVIGQSDDGTVGKVLIFK
ncbi:protease [Pontibacillus chungwhensis BH030062]|uniref:Protease n=1 Tax=Pontibacillus chungwhensis BH030062 TaxID=1385513 RepID=A0A0A2UXK0_9BACI|nr:immune inhibitor A domain-containing protein [Pontibacillus chungwhensis]KGP91473.1 protease [Pontibacillus chungwhensis BH030062]